jgi:predicted RNA-binding protein (virulence factor B family)
MVELGKKNYLQIIQQLSHGFYLDGGREMGRIFLPANQAPKGFGQDDWLEVFVYLDSQDKPVATTRTPFVEVGQFASLQVVDVSAFGAFMDWGLDKDLMVPRREQVANMQIGKTYMVYVYLDERDKRITATTRIDNRLHNENHGRFKKGQPVNIQIWRKTELGYAAIIENSHLGMLYENEIFQKLRYGQKLTATIKNIRDDDLIDLSLNAPAKQSYDELPEKILAYLRRNHGTSSITDKSPPEEIYDTFAVSKVNFKKAVGRLLKEKKVALEPGKIRLLEKVSPAAKGSDSGEIWKGK